MTDTSELPHHGRIGCGSDNVPHNGSLVRGNLCNPAYLTLSYTHVHQGPGNCRLLTASVTLKRRLFDSDLACLLHDGSLVCYVEETNKAMPCLCSSCTLPILFTEPSLQKRGQTLKDGCFLKRNMAEENGESHLGYVQAMTPVVYFCSKALRQRLCSIQKPCEKSALILALSFFIYTTAGQVVVVVFFGEGLERARSL